eukprot:scaffold3725_cov203-Chaetoceros_neogracile.AAC.5
MVKDLYDRNQDHNDLRLISDLLPESQSFENELAFHVYDLIEVGHGIFCVLIAIYCYQSLENYDEDFIEQYRSLLDLDEYLNEDPNLVGVVALLSFSASNGREAVLDCIMLPASTYGRSLSSNLDWKYRSDSVEIVCNSLCWDERTDINSVTNMDRSGLFHRKPFFTRTPLSHTLRTPSRLVGYSKVGGILDVYHVEDDLPTENLPLKTEFNTMLSMNHLGNDYVMMLCRRDAISVPADEDIDDQRNMYWVTSLCSIYRAWKKSMFLV